MDKKFEPGDPVVLCKTGLHHRYDSSKSIWVECGKLRGHIQRYCSNAGFIVNMKDTEGKRWRLHQDDLTTDPKGVKLGSAKDKYEIVEVQGLRYDYKLQKDVHRTRYQVLRNGNPDGTPYIHRKFAENYVAKRDGSKTSHLIKKHADIDGAIKYHITGTSWTLLFKTVKEAEEYLATKRLLGKAPKVTSARFYPTLLPYVSDHPGTKYEPKFQVITNDEGGKTLFETIDEALSWIRKVYKSYQHIIVPQQVGPFTNQSKLKLLHYEDNLYIVSAVSTELFADGKQHMQGGPKKKAASPYQTMESDPHDYESSDEDEYHRLIRTSKYQYTITTLDPAGKHYHFSTVQEALHWYAETFGPNEPILVPKPVHLGKLGAQMNQWQGLVKVDGKTDLYKVTAGVSDSPWPEVPVDTSWAEDLAKVIEEPAAKFDIGDRVRLGQVPSYHQIPAGAIGTIVKDKDEVGRYGVRWDAYESVRWTPAKDLQPYKASITFSEPIHQPSTPKKTVIVTERAGRQIRV
jgi:hypothetical protein